MSKLIIYVGGRPLMNGHKRRNFIWSEHHKCYIYDGRELSAEEFNDVYAKAVKGVYGIQPKVKVVGLTETAIARHAVSMTPAEPSATAVANVTTITTAREITTEEAIAVLARTAPEMLKKRVAGRPPNVMEVA